jgi:hypothetical protein
LPILDAGVHLIQVTNCRLTHADFVRSVMTKEQILERERVGLQALAPFLDRELLDEIEAIAGAADQDEEDIDVTVYRRTPVASTLQLRLEPLIAVIVISSSALIRTPEASAPSAGT